ncbi:MAG: hypothetical protein IPH72_15940 [Sandaracinaceae bacterium]|nr:hypothetical protein [Sandaracinaceae bacterium]
MQPPELSSHHRPIFGRVAERAHHPHQPHLPDERRAPSRRFFCHHQLLASEGKTTIARNIAIALAHASKFALLHRHGPAPVTRP